MALNPHLADAAANAAADAIAALADSGVIKVYSGTQPATANTAIGGTNHLLATLTMAADAFPSPASGGVVTAGAITPGTAIYSATATWFRLLESDTTTALCDGSVGTGNANLILNSTAIVSGAAVAVSAFTLTITE